MQQTSMTALVSLFARAYHTEQDPCPVFRDSLAGRLLTDEEYRQIGAQMAAGISFFVPGFQGTEAEALRYIVDRQLAPSPLGRAVFAEEALARAVAIGARQYCLLGAGYDSFACRQPAWARSLQIFELDRPDGLADKRLRLERAGLEVPDNVHFVPADLAQPQWRQNLLDSGAFRRRVTFCSLLGLVYYLPAPPLRRCWQHWETCCRRAAPWCSTTRTRTVPRQEPVRGKLPWPRRRKSPWQPGTPTGRWSAFWRSMAFSSMSIFSPVRSPAGIFPPTIGPSPSTP